MADAEIAQLVGMGFTAEQAAGALDACYGSFDQAVDLLLASDGPDAPTAPSPNNGAPAASYSHKAPDGTWQRYTKIQAARIDAAVKASPGSGSRQD